MDYNGTIACDGELLPGVKEGLIALVDDIGIHVLTVDTFGQAHSFLEAITCKFSLIGKENQDLAKLEYIACNL